MLFIIKNYIEAVIKHYNSSFSSYDNMHQKKKVVHKLK